MLRIGRQAMGDRGPGSELVEADVALWNGVSQGDRPRYRVLMVAASPYPLPQGSQVLIAGLARTLCERGHDIRILAYPTGQRMERPGVPVQRIRPFPFYRRLDPGPSFWKPLMDLRLARRVLREVVADRPDLLHTHNFEGLLVGLWVRRRTGIPVLYHLHNLMEPELPDYFRFWPGRWAGRWVGRWVDRTLPRRADASIVLSDRTLSYIEEKGEVERAYVIPPGVDLPPLVAPSDEVRRRWNLGDGPLLLYSGNLDRYQNLEVLLEAFRRVCAVHRGIQLVLAIHQGIEGRRRAFLANRLPGGARLLAVADWPQMASLIGACDLAVIPRQVCWGFPIKLLNYMAAARPVVAMAASAPGLRHLETGWVVLPGEKATVVSSLAQAILALLQDPRLAARLGAAARREVERRYTWSASAAGVEAVYGALLSDLRAEPE